MKVSDSSPWATSRTRVGAACLFLDVDKAHRRAQLDGYASTYGTCRADGAFDVENALRGQWTMRCDRGALRVAITLAPTVPPTVQYLSVTPIPAEATGPAARVCGQ